jgi:hypothetical protein
VLGAFTDGNVSVRTEAGVGLVTGELFGCATEELGGSDTGFFSAPVFSGLSFAAGADGFGAGGVSRPAGCSTGFAPVAEDVEADDEESER